ncbi:MAG TPA: DMT family transporter [Acidobacteriota bacterium]|nr:DMT family transporter [Acidobacteriota bacterium]
MTQPTHQRTSVALLIFGVFAVGPASIFIRLADAPAITVAFYRMVVAAVAIGIIVLLRGRRDLVGIDRASLVRSIVSGLFLAVHFASWIASLDYTSVANSVIVVSTQPIWAALFGMAYLREGISPKAFAAIGLALVGVLTISGGNPEAGGWHGDALALIGAIAAAAYLVVGRQVRRTVSTMGYVLISYSTAAVVLGIWSLAIRTPLGGFTSATWMWMVAAGLGPSVIGHTIYNRALKDFSAHTVATTILGGEALLATTLAMIVLAEYPSPWAFIGAIPIAIGITWALRLERGRRIP